MPKVKKTNAAQIRLAENGALRFFVGEEEIFPSSEISGVPHRGLFKALRSYLAALRELSTTLFADVSPALPPHVKHPVRLIAALMPEGLLLRYEPLVSGDSQVVMIGSSDYSLFDVITVFSGGAVRIKGHESQITRDFKPPKFRFGNYSTIDDFKQILAEGEFKQEIDLGCLKKRHCFSRPPTLFSASGLMTTTIQGQYGSLDGKAVNSSPFSARMEQPLALTWTWLEVYDKSGIEEWCRTNAHIAAERDIFAFLTQTLSEELVWKTKQLTAPRELFTHGIETLKAMLADDSITEERIHQHLVANTWLLAWGAKRVLSKQPFGKSISDFVVEQSTGDYTLIEIEHPSRKLFNKDGHFAKDVNHAFDQINDWLRYIADNKMYVEHELNLRGISTTPTCMIVIGRSGQLSTENRMKLQQDRVARPKFLVLTYDELIDKTQAHIEAAFGPPDNAASFMNFAWGSLQQAKPVF